MKCLVCDIPNDHPTDECPYGDGIDYPEGTCQRGTPGCIVDHNNASTTCEGA